MASGTAPPTARCKRGTANKTEIAMKLHAALLGSILLLGACANQPPSTSLSRAEINQPSAEVRDAQQRLRVLGLYNGPIDGVWGNQTKDAVERFQSDRNMAVTARLDDYTIGQLRNAASTTPVVINDATDVRTIQNRLKQLNFYNGNADGVWGSSSQVALEAFQRARGLPVGQINVASISAMGLDPNSFPSRNVALANPNAPAMTMNGDRLDNRVVRNVQSRLNGLGYYNGRIDGVWGPRTQTGLTDFQRSRGLEANGQLNPTTASALGLDPNNLSASITAIPRR
jgi:peptidoglycan hydrolase-like protein with peptidoglycan-binding domain